MPLVSVLMAVRDDAARVRASARSILHGTWTDLELVVVDDGSRDDTPAALAELAREDARVVVLTVAAGGLTAALTAGVKRCAGAILARQDAGDLSHPARLARQVALLGADPALVAVGSAFAAIDEAGRALATNTPPVRVGARELAVRNPFAHGSLAMHRSAFDRVGGYRAVFRRAQDYDLLLRLVDVGFLGAAPEVLYAWRQEGRGVTARHAAEQAGYAALARASARARARGTLDPAANDADAAQVVRCAGKAVCARRRAMAYRLRCAAQDRLAAGRLASARVLALAALGFAPESPRGWYAAARALMGRPPPPFAFEDLA